MKSSEPNEPHTKSGDVVRDRLPVKEKLSYGAGIFSFNLSNNAVKELALPVYNIMFGISPGLVGLVLALARVWDAFTDPLMGYISDNTRSRWGRRRPYVFIGAILCGLVFPLIWAVPPSFGDNAKLGYFVVTALMFYTSFTVYGVTYTALGFELTPDYYERTSVMAIRAYFAKATILFIPWIYPLAQFEFFGDPVTGIRATSAVAGFLILATGLVPAILSRERYQVLAVKQKQFKLLKAVGQTLKSKAFLSLISVTVMLQISMLMVNSLGLYLNIYYLFDGNAKAGGSMNAIGFGISAFGGVLAIFLINFFRRRFDKRTALGLAMFIMLLGYANSLWTYNPAIPTLQFLTHFCVGIGVGGFWILINSMKADICDEDESVTGLRREGMYGAVATWIQKLGMAGSYIVSGIILEIAYFNPDLGGDQLEGTIEILRYAYATVPTAVAIFAIIVLRHYPLTADRMQKIRTELETKRGTV